MAADGASIAAADVEAARSLADAVDVDPGNSPMWGRYLDALAVLRDAATAAVDGDEVADLLARLREP